MNLPCRLLIFYSLANILLAHPLTFNITYSYDLKYAFVDYKTSWWNARHFCYQLFVQDLASIHNQEDNSEAFDICASKNCWIGATNLFLWNNNISNNTEWIDGTSYDFNPTPINYTVNNQIPYGCTRYDNNSYWRKSDCLTLQYAQLPFICNQNDTLSPTNSPSISPSNNPTNAPSNSPTNPTNAPTFSPSDAPTNSPTIPTSSPTNAPSYSPSDAPSLNPTVSPSGSPSQPPTIAPSDSPTQPPSAAPSYSPSFAPSDSPSISPSVSPTQPPTLSPSSSPSQPPTMAPTVPPSIAPSTAPTASPLFTPCSIDYDLDLIFAVDTSCGITQPQCQKQQTFISSLIQKSKSSAFPRLAYIEFDDVVDETIKLNDSLYNVNSTSIGSNLAQLINDIEAADCTQVAPSNTSTEIALVAAIQQFQDYSIPLGHDKKIILISNCPSTDNPCDVTQDLYTHNIDVIIVNVGVELDNATYSCISKNDPRRMFYAPSFNSLTTNLTDKITREICEQPTLSPTAAPSVAPSLSPSVSPTSPTKAPTNSPSSAPSIAPTSPPTSAPSLAPSIAPTMAPSVHPSVAPSLPPSVSPTSPPTLAPSFAPSTPPTVAPTFSPSMAPSSAPTSPPSTAPTGTTLGPTTSPTVSPTDSPSFSPTTPPSLSPSSSPTAPPSVSPTFSPSGSPSQPPTFSPSGSPSQPPSFPPSQSPTQPPTNSPTTSPTPPSMSPSSAPTSPPSAAPTNMPTVPTIDPTPSPTTNRNECYGSDYIFCFFMDISLKEFVTIIDESTTNAAAIGVDVVSFTIPVINIPVSDVFDITYIIQWRPINYPCYNPEVSLRYKPIAHPAAVQVWKGNQTQIGSCSADKTDCLNYEDCALDDNLDVAIIDTYEWHGINLTEPAQATGSCAVAQQTISMDFEVTLWCDLEPNKPGNIKPAFIDSVIEEIQCNDSITYKSNANGATSNYYNVRLSQLQSNITIYLCISEADTLLTINEWNGHIYHEKYMQAPIFDNVSSIAVFDEFTMCEEGDGYYTEVIDEYLIASNDYYYVGVLVNGSMIEGNSYEYALVLECNSYNPHDIEAEAEPIQCHRIQIFASIVLPLFVLVAVLSAIIFISELVYYINTTHKLLKVGIGADAPFCLIFNKATGLNKCLYILDFVALFVVTVLSILFFAVFKDELKGSTFLNTELFIIGGVGCMVVASLSFTLLYVKWKRFLCLYFVVMNSENRIKYQKNIILYDLFSAALQDGMLCCILLIVLSGICTNELWIHWLLTSMFIIYFMWLLWKVLRALMLLRVSNNYQHEKKQSVGMLAKEDNEAVGGLTKIEMEMQRIKTMSNHNVDVSLTMESPYEVRKKERKKSDSFGMMATNAGFGEGADDLMLPDEYGQGYKWTDGDFGAFREERKQEQEEDVLITANMSHFRARVCHSHYIQVCDALMQRYGIISGDNQQRQCALASSGINAISSLFHGIFVEYGFNVKLNIVISNDLYYDSETLLNYLSMHYSIQNAMNINVIVIGDITNDEEIIHLFQSEAVKNANNILFIESCTNPHGHFFNFDLVATFKSLSSPNSYVVVDNTLLTSAVFNPLQYGADIAVISLSKFYSGGNGVGGAILCSDEAKNMKLMKQITNWIIINGIHVSSFYCKWILQNTQLLDKRMENVSIITRNIVFYLRDLVDKAVFAGQLLQINHPFLLNHVSNDLCKKYCGSSGPAIIAIKIALKNHNNIQKWLGSSKKIKKQLSFGKKETRFDIALQTINDGTWCKLSIGWNLTIDDIKEELVSMFQTLSSIPN